MSKPLLSAMVLLSLVLAGMVGATVWESNRFPVKLSTLRELRPGATQDDIRHLFGTPQDVHDLFGDHRWCYYRTNSTRIVYVIFDTNTLYKGYELDD